MRDDPFTVFGGIMLAAVLASVINLAPDFWYLIFLLEGRCPYCGYLRTHPIIKHDDLIVECGWR